MKRVLIVLLTVVSLFSLCSCVITKNICYYAFFKDTAFMLVYSPAKNTLYEITIPPEAISQYGRSMNIASIPDAMRSFAGIEESGFMIGIPQTLDAIKEILNAMSAAENPTAEDRLAVVAHRASDFSNEALLSRMNSLCGTDLSPLVNVLKLTEADVCVLDASNVVSITDPEFSQKYFKKFLSQVINK